MNFRMVSSILSKIYKMIANNDINIQILTFTIEKLTSWAFLIDGRKGRVYSASIQLPYDDRIFKS